MEDIELGSVVELKSGSPAMTVEGIESGRIVDCCWFSAERNEILKRTFVIECLKLWKPPTFL